MKFSSYVYCNDLATTPFSFRSYQMRRLQYTTRSNSPATPEEEEVRAQQHQGIAKVVQREILSIENEDYVVARGWHEHDNNSSPTFSALLPPQLAGRPPFLVVSNFCSVSLLRQRIHHRWLLHRSNVIPAFSLFRLHLLILLYQGTATTKCGSEAVGATVALDAILAAQLAPAHHLGHPLKAAA